MCLQKNFIGAGVLGEVRAREGRGREKKDEEKGECRRSMRYVELIDRN